MEYLVTLGIGLESTPSNGSIPIKQGGLIPDGRMLYKAFPGADDYFIYKVRYKADNIL